jgi:hypothetical protein
MFIPDPGSDFFPSRIRFVPIADPESASKNLSILTQKKWFLSSRKYDLGCSSRIPDPDPDFLPIPDPGFKKAPDPGSGSAKLILSMKNDENLPSKCHNTLIFVKKKPCSYKKRGYFKVSNGPIL